MRRAMCCGVVVVMNDALIRTTGESGTARPHHLHFVPLCPSLRRICRESKTKTAAGGPKRHTVVCDRCIDTHRQSCDKNAKERERARKSSEPSRGHSSPHLFPAPRAFAVPPQFYPPNVPAIRLFPDLLELGVREPPDSRVRGERGEGTEDEVERGQERVGGEAEETDGAG